MRVLKVWEVRRVWEVKKVGKVRRVWKVWICRPAPTTVDAPGGDTSGWVLLSILAGLESWKVWKVQEVQKGQYGATPTPRGRKAGSGRVLLSTVFLLPVLPTFPKLGSRKVWKV